MEINILEQIRKILKKRNNSNQTIIFSFVALVTIIISISDLVSTMSFISKAQSTEGKYVEVKSNKGTIPKLKIGDKVKVIYDPFIPQKAIINNFGQNGGWGLVFCIVGLLFTYIPCLPLLVTKSKLIQYN
ncbi:MAG: DUF3592 domain-containing protein [Candidatus Cloacimonetes bacterium]|nr:DUF3592 domain-containing protein [Candidatus Cloacimonadota bacterium]